VNNFAKKGEEPAKEVEPTLEAFEKKDMHAEVSDSEYETKNLQ